jgi:hypothetical protein
MVIGDVVGISCSTTCSVLFGLSHSVQSASSDIRSSSTGIIEHCGDDEMCSTTFASFSGVAHLNKKCTYQSIVSSTYRSSPVFGIVNEQSASRVEVALFSVWKVYSRVLFAIYLWFSIGEILSSLNRFGDDISTKQWHQIGKTMHTCRHDTIISVFHANSKLKSIIRHLARIYDVYSIIIYWIKWLTYPVIYLGYDKSFQQIAAKCTDILLKMCQNCKSNRSFMYTKYFDQFRNDKFAKYSHRQ